VSTEWIVLVYFMKYGVTITKFSQMYDAFVRCSNKSYHFAPPPENISWLRPWLLL